MKYILIMIFVTNADSIAIDSAEFDSKEACENARTEILQASRSEQVIARKKVLRCVPKSTVEP